MAYNWELRFEMGLSLLLPLVVCSLLNLFPFLVLLAKLLLQLGDGCPRNGKLALSFPQVYKLFLSLPFRAFNGSLSTFSGLITLNQLEEGLL